MSVADILKIHGKWADSEQAVTLISEKMAVSERHAYRLLKSAFKNGDIKRVERDGAIFYGLTEFGPPNFDKLSKEYYARKTSFSNAFLLECFKKLDKITANVHGQSPDYVFRELIFFIATLPKEVKDKIKPLQDKALEAVRAKKQWEPEYKRLSEDELLRFLERTDDPDADFKSECYRQVLLLVDEISTNLHEYSKKSN